MPMISNIGLRLVSVKLSRLAGAGLLIMLLFGMSGCLIATKNTVITPQITSLFKGTYKVDPYMETHRPVTVAVLPFLDQSQNKEGAVEVRKGFYNHFSSLPFQNVQMQRVDNLLAKADLADQEALFKKTPQELGKILNVDAVIYGEISNFDKLFAVMYSQVSVGAEIRMYDTKTGNFLWSGKHTERIHEGGLSVTPIGIIATVVATSMNLRDIQLLRACDDLFREMVKTIPLPTMAEALRLPAIALLTQDTKNLPKKAGDEIKVVIQGAPKMQAYFDIGDFRKHIDMQEQEPGWYLGTYKVLPGDNVSQALLTGYLADDAGNASSWVDALGTITIDTIPPEQVKNIRAVGRNNLVLLNWEKSPAPDLAGYRVYRSATPLSGFGEAGRSELNEWRDEKAQNGQKYYYYVTALDRAGNEGEKTEALPGMPIAPGPTPVAGPIEADTTWYAGASPYIIGEPVLIRDKATLMIEPGTEIRSQGGGLIVEGQIKAQGTKENLIIFAAAEEGKVWEGILFNGIKEKDNELSHLRISGARTAVTCESSSPHVLDTELTGNGRALLISGAFSQPEVRRNAIHKNREGAVLITAGAKPLVAENTIADNQQAGLVIESAEPTVQKNTIVRNQGSGIVIHNSNAVIRENKIFDNRPLEMEADATGQAVDALENWWGSASGLTILSRISGKINIATILDGEPPTGKVLALPILESQLGVVIDKDSFLTLSNSPFRVTRDLTVAGGATLYIEPGVRILYEQNRAINVEDGGIQALGTRERPIIFTAAAKSPLPGFYAAAVRFKKTTQIVSAFNYCTISYGETAFDVYAGAPEISYCLIAHNSQSGIFCRNDAAPKITYSTFEDNMGEGAIRSVGASKPILNHNNFFNNAVAVQAFSSLCLDARYNWWGSAPPDEKYIFKSSEDSINIKPWLERPEEEAFKRE